MKIINILILLTILLPITTFLLLSSNSTPVNNILYLHEHCNKTMPAQQQLNALISSSSNCVVLQFYADWCQPCVNMSKLIAIVAPNIPNVTIIKINRDHFMNLARAYGVTSIPTLIFLHNGRQIARYDGKPLTQQKLTDLITATYGMN
jgi:thioredoxin 1